NDKELKIEDLKVFVRDTAHPRVPRGPRHGQPPCHDNIALTDFRAGTRVAGKDMPVQFALTIANYATRDAEVDIDVIDMTTGQRLPDIDFNPPMPVKVPSGSPITAHFDKRFPELPGRDGYFVQLAAKIKEIRGQAKDHLADDNVRYTALEIRNKVPILIIDGL